VPYVPASGSVRVNTIELVPTWALLLALGLASIGLIAVAAVVLRTTATRGS